MILLKGLALNRDLADRSLIFFRTKALKDMASLAIKDFARTQDVRGLFAKDALPSSALKTAFEYNTAGLTLRRAHLISSFKVVNRGSQPVLVLVPMGKKSYQEATPENFASAALWQETTPVSASTSASASSVHHPAQDRTNRTVQTAKRTAAKTAAGKTAKKGKV